MVFLGRDSFIFYIVKHYGKPLRQYSTLLAIMKEYYPWLLDDILLNRCSFCKKQFRSRKGLVVHYKERRQCHNKIIDIAKHVLDIYEKVKQYTRYEGNGVYKIMIGNPHIRVQSIQEAIRVLRANKIIP